MQIVPDYLPTAFGIVVLTAALAIALSPYLAGVRVGSIEIPNIQNEGLKRSFKWIGPIALIFAVFIHIPFGTRMCDEPVNVIKRDRIACGTEREEYITTPARPDTCSRPEFGIARWQRSTVVARTSGWRRGGYNPDAWCNDVKAIAIQTLNAGAIHDTKVVAKSEEKRKRFGEAQYNYHCSVQIQWQPIHNTRTHPLCGMLEPVKAFREVAKQCPVQVGTKRVACKRP